MKRDCTLHIGRLPKILFWAHKVSDWVSHTDSLQGSRLVVLIRTQTSGNSTGVNKPMISRLIDVNETVGYKVKNYWTVNYYAVSKHCGLAKFVWSTQRLRSYTRDWHFKTVGSFSFLALTCRSIPCARLRKIIPEGRNPETLKGVISLKGVF